MLGIGLASWSGVARADATAPVPAPASASAPAPAVPDAGQIQFAAREHDQGYRAYVADEYDEAASHFENAFFAAPNPAELRSAIRARRDAGQLARAATLAAIGQRRFPDDPSTGKVAADVIALARPRVYEVQISSSAEYSVAIDEKIVAAERVKDSRLFVNPGTHQLLVSWSAERNTRIPIEAVEGGTRALELEPPAAPVATPLPPPPLRPAPSPAVVPAPAELPAPAQSLASKPFEPPVFVAGAALTAIGVGLIVWSGVETLNNPGRAAVRQACSAGPSATCTGAYDEGRGWQLRTNVFVAVTSGVALATAAVGLFFTQWSPSTGPVGARAAASPVVTPVVGIGHVGLAGAF